MSVVVFHRSILLAPIFTLFRFLNKYAVEIFLIIFILYTFISRGLNIGVVIHDPEMPFTENSVLSVSALLPFSKQEAFADIRIRQTGDIQDGSTTTSSLTVGNSPATEEIMVERSIDPGQASTVAIKITAPATDGHDDFNSVAVTDDPAPHISNLTLILSPDYAKRKKLPAHIIRAKKQRVRNYVNSYAKAAQ
ncbi:MAG: hypothetical protein AAFU67_15535, partial [Bacteroidota bacterium]